MATGSASDITWWAVVSAFGGAIIGSVLGGIVSYCLQRQSLAATKALHDADRKDVRKALGYGLMFKMIRLGSNLTTLGNPVSEAVADAQAKGKKELWPFVLPILPLPHSIKFSAEEMALVLSLDNKLFNDMAALDDLHKIAIALFDLYAKKRMALTDTLRPQIMEGNLGTTQLSKAELDGMRPRSVELDMIIQGMLERTIPDAKIAWNCLGRLHQALEKEFDLKHKLELKPKYQAALQDAAAPQSQPYYHSY